MTKSEKFAKAIKEALATVEQRRALYWNLCHEYAAKSAEEGSNEELINQLSAFLFAAEATNLLLMNLQNTITTWAQLLCVKTILTHLKL